MTRAFVIAILGAESTGKTTLVRDLAKALSADGRNVGVVPEYLRQFCDREGRTPREDEQRDIADEQTRRIDQAAGEHDIVVADTTALQIAVYSDLVYADESLYSGAQAAHRLCDLTLLTALDLPWEPDGLQRDGQHVCEPVDALLRRALQRTGVAYSVISGHGAQRLDAALAAARHAIGNPGSASRDDAGARWQWVCDRCGDPNCERHLLPQIPAPSGRGRG
jgi:nicotinamide riboside kinase